MRRPDDGGCWATAVATVVDWVTGEEYVPANPTHIHRCRQAIAGHRGLHTCGCGVRFDLDSLPSRLTYEHERAQRGQEILDLEVTLALPAYQPSGDQRRTTPDDTGRHPTTPDENGALMASPLDNLITITFVSDANTPAQYASSAGKVIALQTAVQVGASGHLAGIPGVVRQGASGLEFLMTAEGAGPADTSPAWAQQLATTLATINGKLDTIIGGAAQNTDMQTALTRLNTIIGGAARQVTLNAVGADVAAIKTKTGA